MHLEYKLIKDSLNDLDRIKETVFRNRGIKNIERFTHLSEKDEHSYELLDHIHEAIDLYLKHLEAGNHIHIIVDSDTDGYTSAAILYMYTKELYPDCNLTYSLHTGKQHGLSKDIDVGKKVNLLIIPDAGTNDTDECKAVKDMGVDVLILDHHDSELENPYAIIVNNQMCNYPNKFLSGVGVVYKFLQAVDEETWNNKADGYLDLVALGLIGDNMDVRDPETRWLIDEGLRKIHSPVFKALLKKQEFSMPKDFSGHDVQFYIVPLINGMIRCGDSDEKDLMFRAFICQDEMFSYKPRGGTETEEDIYTRCARLCFNAKTRQKNAQTKCMDKIIESIESQHADKNKIIFGNVTDLLDFNLTGVMAIKIADYFMKPCLLLRKRDGTNAYSGSGRNPDYSPIPNFKEFLLGLGTFNFVQGHPNAFGVEIERENIPITIQKSNEILKTVSFEKCLLVDFILDVEQLSISVIRDLNDLRNYYGSYFSEPQLAVTNIVVTKEMFVSMKEGKHWKVDLDEGVSIVKFFDSSLREIFEDHDEITMTVVGKASISNFKGILQCQLIVTDYEVEGVKNE